jgi:CIC family chloride channel protein
VRVLRLEARLAPTEAQRLFALTIAIGVVCGLAAVAFHFSIAFGERMLIERALRTTGWARGSVVLTPILGGVVGGLLLQYVVPNARGSGIPQVKIAYASRGGFIRLRDAVGKFFLSSLQIGSGASLGREGPTVQICAGIASALGRIARVSPDSRRRLIPVGAAAGIAAAFNAPIAAVTFTIEEVVGNLDQTVLSGVIVAAALAAVIERSVLGAHPVFDVLHPFTFEDARSLLLYPALGVGAALVSIAFTDGLLYVRKRFRQLERVPGWAKPALGGAVTGALALVALVALDSGGVNGGGYSVLKQALSGSLTVKVMLALGACKLVATIFSYSSGGAGGIFAPSLFLGAMLGGAFGSLDRTLFHHADDTLGAFALVGMGAVFGGVVRAPMTSVLIIVELTSGYGLILPLMIANMTAYGIARRYRPEPIYEALLAQDGIHLRQPVMQGVLEKIAVGSLLASGQVYESVHLESRGSDLLSRLHNAQRQRVFPVLDKDDRMVGLITADDIAQIENQPELELLVNASDLMRPPVSVRDDDDARTAYDRMRTEGLRELPVLDSGEHVTGAIDELAIAEAYLKATAGGSASVRRAS